ncbi:MAG: polysaccharide pyruvyl transferase CsaB [Clostridiales bacterium]|jgi:polysaccharide pyruvyl transferase CsaB|nr:polysaccharide pyruvyl transferase CsaB [Eubacteriales bacterium]MDH7567823.1 polysaccharide pyruvyl transferase CsaB [Clostridiales bacterium]
MKVLHLIGGGDVGGARVHVLSLVKELSKYIDVKIISFRPGMFADEARDMGINIEIVKTGNIVADIRRVIAVIKQEGYEIIHSHGAKANMIALIAESFTGLPTVTTVHSDYRLDYLESMVKQMSFGMINTIALRFIDYYIGVSNNFREMLIERKFDPSRIFTVYNGINFDRRIKKYSRSQFAKKYNLDLAEDDIVVGILARLYPVKGLGTFVSAAKEVLDKNPFIKFIIGGDGEDRESLQKTVHSLGISGSVFFTGWVDDPYEFMSNLDINVLTSISESFPYSILEGALLRKATISSNVGGIADLIDSGENGYLFNAGDYGKLAEYILKLADSGELRESLGEKIYRKAKSQFSLDNMCKSQLEIYRKILDAHRARHENAKGRKKYLYDAIISGYYGSGNIGDDAILAAIISGLHMYKKDIKVLVMSRNPIQTKKTYHVDSINRTNPFQVLWAMKNSRLFINGGGSLIQDIKSTRSLLYYLSTIWLAKKMGLKVMIYANGIGPISRQGNKKRTRHVLNLVDVITLRENLSRRELSLLKVDKPRIVITADPALTIEAADDRCVDKIFREEGIDFPGPFIGFSVRKWKCYEKYEDVIAQVADYMTQTYGIKALFLPMHYPGDLDIIENILSKMKEKGYVIRKKYDGNYVLGIIKRMEMLVGMRLHALIFAASAGIPIIGLEYEQKVEGFLQYINQAGYASAGHVRDLEYGKLKDAVESVWKNRQNIKIELEKNTSGLKEKALENAKIAVQLIEG